jgi:2-amino-4-hydroxy-6-hydroxymethyldihydropteridine diphosphokinase
MNTVIISAGSNIDPFANLDKAKDFLEEELRIIACAKRLTTSPVEFLDQPDFVNTVFLVETDLDAASLVSFLKGVEARLGRVRGPNKSGPRTIDLDIAVFNGEIVDNDVFERVFLKELVLEVAPELRERLSQ